MKTLLCRTTLTVLTFILSCARVVYGAAGELDESFTLNADGDVTAAAVQPDGKILIAGNFTMIGTASRNYIARLEPNGALDTTFDPALNFPAYCVATLEDGRIIVGGNFSKVDGINRQYLARLNSDGSLDTAFTPGIPPGGIGSNPKGIIVQSDGKLLVRGSGLIRLEANGAVDSTFLNTYQFDTPTVSPSCFALEASGKIIVGGAFTSVMGQPRNRMARLLPNGTLDDTFSPDIGTTGTGSVSVNTIAVQPDGKLVIGGSFKRVGPVDKFYIARLNPDGSLDATFGTNAEFFVSLISIEAEGKITIGGAFRSIDDRSGSGYLTRERLARLMPDGSLDPGFTPSAGASVHTLCYLKDGRLLVGGAFTTLNGNPRGYMGVIANDAAPQSLITPNHNRIEWPRGGAAPELDRVSFDYLPSGAVAWQWAGVGQRYSAGWLLNGLSLAGVGQIRARGYRAVDGDFSTYEIISPYSFGFPPEIQVFESQGNEVQTGATRSFGEEFLGGSMAMALSIRNDGSEPLSAVSVTVEGASAGEFEILNPPSSTIAFNTTSSFVVRFTPTLAGQKSADRKSVV